MDFPSQLHLKPVHSVAVLLFFQLSFTHLGTYCQHIIDNRM